VDLITEEDLKAKLEKQRQKGDL